MIDFASPREGQALLFEFAPLAAGRQTERETMANEHMLKAKLDYFAKMKMDAAICLMKMGAGK